MSVRRSLRYILDGETSRRVARRLAGCVGIAAHAPPLSDPASAHLRMLPRGLALPLRSSRAEVRGMAHARFASARSGAVEPVRQPAMMSDRHNLQYH